MARLTLIWENTNISTSPKTKLSKNPVLVILTCGSESWTLNEYTYTHQKIHAFEMTGLRLILKTQPKSITQINRIWCTSMALTTSSEKKKEMWYVWPCILQARYAPGTTAFPNGWCKAQWRRLFFDLIYLEHIMFTG